MNINKKCSHIETGAIGIIKNQMAGTKDFPDQYGIFWIENANNLLFANHYYWTDKNKIKIHGS